MSPLNGVGNQPGHPSPPLHARETSGALTHATWADYIVMLGSTEDDLGRQEGQV